MKQPETVAPGDVFGSLAEFELKAAPRKLFLRGDASLLEGGPRIAVAGSRRAVSEGLELARRTTEVPRGADARMAVPATGMLTSTPAHWHPVWHAGPNLSKRGRKPSLPSPGCGNLPCRTRRAAR